MQLFHHFLNFFWLIDSRLDLVKFFKCINFSFSLLFSFPCSHGLSTSGNHAYHRWTSSLKHLFLCEDCFSFWLFGPKLFIPLLSTKRVMAQKYFRGMGNFRSMCLKALVRMISVYHDLGILFCSLKMFGRFETVASLDAYQIINYQFLSKTHHFLLPDFRRIREISF